METRTSPILDALETREALTNPSAPCPHFGICGGCSIQNLSYSDQLAKKEKLVRTHLQEFSIGSFLPVLPSPSQSFYRNKMEYSFGDERDVKILNQPSARLPVHLGLHPKGRFSLVTPTPECSLLSSEAQQLLDLVSQWAVQYKIPIYLRKDNSGILRHLVIREGKNTGERMVNLVATSACTHINELAQSLKASGIPITTFLWTVHDGLSDVAQGDKQNVVWGDGSIQEKIGTVTVRITPRTFMQTNTHAAEKMITTLQSWLDVGDTLLDLYCGTGALGLNLAGYFIQVKGIESEPASVESAQATALLNGIVNFSAQKGQVENLLSIFEENRGHVDACIVDPPRAGLHKKVIEALALSGIPLVAYVSCNPESLARDLKGLTSAYEIETVQPLDFFPHTDHIETMVKLHAR